MRRVTTGFEDLGTYALMAVLSILMGTAVMCAPPPAPAAITDNTDTDTINTLPSNPPTSSSWPEAVEFMRDEDAERYAEQGYAPFVASGCIHGTAAGYVGTLSGTCVAYPGGYRVSDATSTVDYESWASANDTCWLAVHKDASGSVSGWNRVGSTHFLVECDSASTALPANPSGGLVVARVTLASGAITSVEDLRVNTPMSNAGSSWIMSSAVCDGSTDDTAAIQADIDKAHGNGVPGANRMRGGRVLLPAGVCMISDQIDLPSGVWLYGYGRNKTIIRVAAGVDFTALTDNAIIRLGDYEGSTAIAFNTGLAYLQLDGADEAGTQTVGVFSQRIQETSGLRHVVIRDFTRYAVNIEHDATATAQNYLLEHSTFMVGCNVHDNASDPSASLRISGAQVHRGVDGLTLNVSQSVCSGNPSATTYGLKLEGVVGGLYTRVNAENHDVGVWMDSASFGVTVEMTDGAGANSPTTMFESEAGADNIFLININRGSSTNTFKDNDRSSGDETVTKSPIAYFANGEVMFNASLLHAQHSVDIATATTIDVGDRYFLAVTNTGGSTVTSFANMSEGQEFVLTFGDGNTTFDFGSNIRANELVDMTMKAQDVMYCNAISTGIARCSIARASGYSAASDLNGAVNTGEFNFQSTRLFGGATRMTTTVDITSIEATSEGDCTTILFTATAATNGVVDDDSALDLQGNFLYTPGDTLSLCFDGTNWYETARSRANATQAISPNACTAVYAIRGNPTEASGTDDYGSFLDGQVGTTEDDYDSLITPNAPDPVCFDHLFCKFSADPGAGGSWAVTLRDDGSDTTLTCSVSNGSTTCADAVARVCPAANSHVNLEIASTSSPTASSRVECSVCQVLNASLSD